VAEQDSLWIPFGALGRIFATDDVGLFISMPDSIVRERYSLTA
jgi:hypothetical protein